MSSFKNLEKRDGHSSTADHAPGDTCRVQLSVETGITEDPTIEALYSTRGEVLASSLFFIADGAGPAFVEPGIGATEDVRPPQKTPEEKGRIGEVMLGKWFDAERLGFVSICQSKESFSSLFAGAVKRPDFFLLLEGIGLLAIDAKNKKLAGDRFTLNLKRELRSAIAFERLFRMPLWYAFRDCDIPDSPWYWISALKAVEVGLKNERKDNGEEFLAIRLCAFEKVESARDLSKLYTQRSRAFHNLAGLPLNA
jgi:hypothetical protein